MDITPYIKAKSDQLNADDLLGGPITVKVEGVDKGNSDQPVVIRLGGGHMPWKPSKTALRVLAHAWGRETNAWVGRWVELFRDPTVTWAGNEVGGVRVKALSDISEPITLALAVARGKKRQQKIDVLKAPKTAGKPTANLDALLAEQKLTRAAVNAWLDSKGKPSLDAAPEKVPDLAGHLAGNSAHLDEIRKIQAGMQQSTGGEE